jgi:hypothetical protein
MTPSAPVQDLAAQWNSARRLYPIYSELAREFAIDLKPCGELESGVETPGKEAVEQAHSWLEQMDNAIQVHQLRQFLQTNTQVNSAGLIALLQHFLAKTTKTDIVRDKIDFLLVQYFSQIAPTGVDDSEVDLAYVAQAMQPIVSQVDLKPPVWLNALDRVLESARRSKSLDELLHGGILEQGRKAKGQAGELFYLPIALVAFTRFGYLMRRTFFRLMLGDLNLILDGLTELEEKGVKTIDCRRAQFSAQEPIVRLRMICQSWKVMFQAEYSSGSPLRMLVDLRASVEHALGRGKAAQPATKGKTPAAAAKPAVAAKPAAAAAAPQRIVIGKPAPGLAAKAAAAGVGAGGTKAVSSAASSAAKKPGKPAQAKAPEFEVSGTPGWAPDSPPVKKK